MPGYTHPDGIKYPIEGDTYSDPAYGGTRWWSDLAVTVQAALLTKADSDEGAQIIPEGHDLRVITQADRLPPGMWLSPSSEHTSTLAGLPEGVTRPFRLHQWAVTGAAPLIRVLLTYDGEGFWFQATDGRGAWEAWVRLDAASTSMPAPRPVPEGHDLTDIAADVRLPQGFFTVGSTALADTITGLPEGMGACAFQQWGQNYSSAATMRLLYGYDGAGIWFQATDRSYQWMPWIRLDQATAGGGDGLGLRHTLLVQDFRDRIGPVRPKGGAVTLRFDHGLATYRDTIRPLILARGLSCTVAMNSRTWEDDENAGVTPTEADAWAEVEFANHSATHQDASTWEGLADEVATGQQELQDQLPLHSIDGFIVPGVGGTQYGGFDAGRSLAAFADTAAGQLILGHHAYSTGAIPDTIYRTMDGELRQGLQHTTIEQSTVSSIQAVIDRAIAGSEAVTLMLHPRYLDLDGYLSTSDLTQVLDYLAARRDAGDLEVLTLGQSLVADVAAGPYDSGPRDMGGLVTDAVTAGTIVFQRVGTWGIYSLQNVSLTGGSGFILRPESVPTGIRPVFDVVGYAKFNGVNDGVRLVARADGYLSFFDNSPGELVNGSLVFPISTEPPSDPPGASA